MKQTIRDVDVKGKVVLVRTDYNVPIENGEVTSDLRISASLPTINYLLTHEAKKIVLISHLGRPEGEVRPEFSLRPVADMLQVLLPGNPIKFVSAVNGAEVTEACHSENAKEIVLLENLRFYAGEEGNSEDFIRSIVEATGAEIFIQDGFAVIHRAHASTDAISRVLPVYAGLRLEKEINSLAKVTENPEHPLTVIIGGAKVADKQPLIEKFLYKADDIIVGGKIAADRYVSDNEKVYVAEDFDETSDGKRMDCGPLATVRMAEILEKSKTVIWNGLLGYAEDPTYATSSTIVAKILGENREIFSVICGGDTAGFVENLKEDDENLEYGLVSTGGGASLDFLCGNPLPGLDCIHDR